MPKITDPSLLSQLDHNIEDDWGPGAREMPDGSVVRYGPRGGLQVLRAAGDGDPAAVKLTEDQGRAEGQLKLMQDAEGKYQNALRAGYNPTSFRNRTASIIDAIPFVRGLAPTIRDDAGDMGHQAQQQWLEAQLRAASGAAVKDDEVRRAAEIFFPNTGETPRITGPVKRQARQVAYDAAVKRAGPLGSKAGPYANTSETPIDLSGGQSRTTISTGLYYRDPQGNIRRNDNGDAGNPIIKPAQVQALINRVNKSRPSAAPAPSGWGIEEVR